MSRNNITHTTQEHFICSHCGMAIGPPLTGTRNRNHCPHCLHSLHLDIQTGDRRSRCRGIMEPISIWVQPNGEWSIIHKCKACGWLRTNRIAPDDTEEGLLEIAVLPLRKPAFPSLTVNLLKKPIKSLKDR
jgi:DNA-directed RNA polymerase subunit RPC12/RpoP